MILIASYLLIPLEAKAQSFKADVEPLIEASCIHSDATFVHKDPDLRLFEILSWPDGKSLQVFDAHEDSVMAVAWRDKSSLASASLDHSVILWDSKTGSTIQTLKGHSRGISSLCVLTDKKTLVSTGIDQSLRVWNLESGGLVHSLSIHTLPVRDLALRPGDNGLPVVASASEDKTVRLWQPTIGRMVRFVRVFQKQRYAV